MKALLLELLMGRGPVIPLLALAAAALVFVLASRLPRHADTIADATGLGRLWIGSMLLATATSLPEVLTAVDAALLRVPDIGVGEDLLGATLVNILTLALLDIAFARRRVLHSAAPGHLRLGVLGILLAGMAGLAIVTSGWGRIGHLGIETLAIGAVYLGVMGALYRSLRDTRAAASGPDPHEPSRGVRRRAFVGFAVAAAGLVAVAPLLVLSAEALAPFR